MLLLLAFLHLLTWARRRPLFMISTLDAWTAWSDIMMRWLLICGSVSLDFIGGQRKEVMHSQTRPTLLLSMLMVRPHLLRRLIMMESLCRAIALRLIPPGCIISVSLFHFVSTCVGHVLCYLVPSLAHGGSSYLFDVYVVHTCIMYV